MRRSDRRNGYQPDALGKIGGASALADDQPLEQGGILGQGFLEPSRRTVPQSGDEGRYGHKRTRSKSAFFSSKLKMEAARRCVVSRAPEGRLGGLGEQLAGLATSPYRLQPVALAPIPFNKAVERPGTRCCRLARSGASADDTRMRFETGRSLVRVQNPAAGPRHVDASSKLIDPFGNRTDTFRFLRTRFEVPQVENRLIRIEETRAPLLSDPDFAHSHRVAADRIQVVVRYEQLDGPTTPNRRGGYSWRAHPFQPLQRAQVLREEVGPAGGGGNERLEQSAGRRWPAVCTVEAVVSTVIPALRKPNCDQERLMHHYSLVFALVSLTARFLSKITLQSPPTPNASDTPRA